MRPRGGPAGQRGRLLARVIWGLVAAVLAVLLLQTFVGDVYLVDTGSMEPTILGEEGAGERVFVLYDRSPPERYELVVVQREGAEAPIVKRVAGMPYESVQIAGGDLFVDGRRVPRAGVPPPIAVFDARHRRLEDVFQHGTAEGDAWSQDADGWWVAGSELPPDDARSWMSYVPALEDDYLTPEGELVQGTVQVNDAILECEALVRDPAARIRLVLAEQGDRFEACIAPDGAGRAEVTLWRTGPEGARVELARGAVAFELGRWTPLAWSNVDDALGLSVGGRTALTHAYEKNALHPGDRAREEKSLGPRVLFGADGGAVGFRDVRILRDLYWTARGAHGVAEPIELGPDEYFVLGDNSARSRDSREWGPVRRAHIVGRPLWVVWPPARIRRL